MKRVQPYRQFIVATRLSPIERDAVADAASLRGEPLSEFLRRVVLANDRVQQALELRERAT